MDPVDTFGAQNESRVARFDHQQESGQNLRHRVRV